MKTLQFKCKLLSDVILNQRAATEGNQESLTFIPGNCFLGIVAKDYMNFQPQKQAEIFHSGHVRFGDGESASAPAERPDPQCHGEKNSIFMVKSFIALSFLCSLVENCV